MFNNKKKGLSALVLLTVILAVVILLATFTKLKNDSHEITLTITSFDECLEAGNTVMESYPEQCRTPDGKNFVRDIGNELEKIDLIIAENPRPGAIIKSPLEIEGLARGYWFFEADFPIVLVDSQNNIIARSIATAKTNWMTEEFVKFKSILEFQEPLSIGGNLLLLKDNPSGLPENEDGLRIPIRFR